MISFCSTAPAYAQSNLEQSWWLNFKQQTKSPAPTASSSPPAITTAEPVSQTPSYFTVPAWFSTPPKAYERPVELFTRSTISDTTVGNSGLPIAPMLSPFSPWSLPGLTPGWGRSAYFGGGGYLPYAGGWGPGFGMPGIVPGLSGMGWANALPYRGFGWGGPLTYGPGYWGASSWGNLYGGWNSPSSSALMMGAFGGRLGSSTLGEWTPPAVRQTAPSKASGNYYEPSTADTSASGSYYATGTPAQTPMVPVNKPTTNFWGPSGNPFSTP